MNIKLSSVLRWGLLLVLLMGPALAAHQAILKGMRRGQTPNVGDESHYLTIARSLIEDHDVLVENNYAAEAKDNLTGFPYEFPPVTPDGHLVAGPHGSTSVHFPGLAILVAPAFKVGLSPAVKRFLALLVTSLATFSLFGIGLLLGLDLWLSAGLAFLTTMSMPYLTSSSHIFPDFISGSLMLVIIYETMRTALKGSSPAWLRAVALLSLAFLPWLHLKNMLLVLLLAAGHYALPLWQGRTGARGWITMRGIIVTSTVAVTAAAIGIYNQYCYGRWQGPYAPGAAISFTLDWPLTVLAGLHIDRVQGMFIQNPWFLIGLLGLPMFLRQRFVWAVWLGLLYCAIILPNAFHACWYGCFCYFGRFWWTVGSLWIIPAMFVIARLGSAQKKIVGWLGFIFGIWQVHMGQVWYAGSMWNLMWGRVDGAPWRLVPVSWLPFMPDFSDPRKVLTSVPNWVAFATVIGVLAFGVVLARAFRRQEKVNSATEPFRANHPLGVNVTVRQSGS